MRRKYQFVPFKGVCKCIAKEHLGNAVFKCLDCGKIKIQDSFTQQQKKGLHGRHKVYTIEKDIENKN